jgi:hypothetical protein
MNTKIATIKYEYNPLTEKAYLFLFSPILAKLYVDLEFPTRMYSKEDYPDLFENFNAYLVRGIDVGPLHTFINKEGRRIALNTQKCGSPSILNRGFETLTINISHIRGVGIAFGFKYQIKPIPSNIIKPTMIDYCDGVYEYYKSLKKHLEQKSQIAKKIDSKIKSEDETMILDNF